jgi:CDP-paratose 2-epimerase
MKATTQRAGQLAGSSPSHQYTLITGGAGFIGANLADRLLREGRRVMIYDNLSRAGVERNVDWLRAEHGQALSVRIGDVRDSEAVLRAVSGASAVFHLAAQVAVTTSLENPLEDFAINAQGTLNVLEAIRAQSVAPPIIMTSTNKVYGGLDDITLQRDRGRYGPVSPEIAANGISESRGLDCQSPYGCSKGTADQYVRDYARSYGIPSIVFRMSCIYGPHQFGTEDQGWVAHFIVRALERSAITLYGDGMQVRDILFVDDLVEAFLLAERNMPQLTGEAFNIGGGPGNVISLLDLLGRIEALHGDCPPVHIENWRTADQRYYVSDTRRFQQATGWRPRVGVEEGIKRLYRWLVEARAGLHACAPA